MNRKGARGYGERIVLYLVLMVKRRCYERYNSGILPTTFRELQIISVFQAWRFYRKATISLLTARLVHGATVLSHFDRSGFGRQSTDDGAAWALVKSALPPNVRNVFCLTQDLDVF